MPLHIGVDYYPEQWPQSLWEEYAEQMQAANFNVVRLAEFAWALMEPEEGHFDFHRLDQAIECLHRHDLSIVLGTPTAAMPAWVKEKYPETLASSDGLRRDAWGVRKNNCFTSGAYRLLSERITRAMAENFKNCAAVIGWQTDNEMDGPVCRCHTCVREFQVWLKDKYKAIDALNQAWGTSFWSHCFSSWEQVQAPTNIQHDNPSLCLDWNRFQTFVQARFQNDQIKILRELCPNHFITHNFMGVCNSSNCYELAADLDFASFDSYPGFHTRPEGVSAFAATSFQCDLTRGLKGKNFWIMETTAGPIGWGEFSRNLRPGEMRKNFYQHVAHGADGQLFFRWRTATSGREQYWHGLLGHDGRAGRRYAEAAKIASEANRIWAEVEGTRVMSSIGLIYDYDSRWATSIQPSFVGNSYVASQHRYYDAFLRAGLTVDIISKETDFSAYRILVASQLHVLPDKIAARLIEFVSAGGILVADIRTGVKDETNLCRGRVLPGLLSAPLGIEIDEYEAVEHEYAVCGCGLLDGDYVAHQYAEWIRPTTAEALADYEQWHVKGVAAATRNRFGNGAGYYVGTVIKGEKFYDRLIADVLLCAGIKQRHLLQSGVEMTQRTSDRSFLLFVINDCEAQQSVDLDEPMTDILTGRRELGTLTLEPFGVSILIKTD